MPQDDEISLFRASWSLYDAISEKNYMFHRELYAHVADLLRQRHQNGPYTLLDLGCGNARFLAPCLQAAPPARYEGIDLSEAALSEAPSYLAPLANTTLRCADMLHAVRTAESTHDVLFSGYAVHHLDTAGKQALFNAGAACLKPGGTFILLDVAREPGQSRQDYLQGYLHNMRTKWTAVRPDHLDEACAHVAAYDFPETLPDLQEMARTAGFTDIRLVDRHAQHHLLLLAR